MKNISDGFVNGNKRRSLRKRFVVSFVLDANREVFNSAFYLHIMRLIAINSSAVLDRLQFGWLVKRISHGGFI